MKYLKKLSATLLFSLTVFSLHAQVKSASGANDDYSNFNIKATLLPYLVGNGWGASTSLGFEYAFLPRHSVVIEGNLNKFSDSRDDVTDTVGIKYSSGNDYHSKGKAVFLGYRYYLTEHRLSESRFSWYISPFIRYGTLSEDKDPSFINDFIHRDEIQRSVGITPGAVIMLGGSSRFSFDIQAGAFYKEKNAEVSYRENSVVKYKHEYHSNIGIRIGMYFCYNFFRSPR